MASRPLVNSISSSATSAERFFVLSCSQSSSDACTSSHFRFISASRTLRIARAVKTSFFTSECIPMPLWLSFSPMRCASRIAHEVSEMSSDWFTCAFSYVSGWPFSRPPSERVDSSQLARIRWTSSNRTRRNSDTATAVRSVLAAKLRVSGTLIWSRRKMRHASRIRLSSSPNGELFSNSCAFTCSSRSVACPPDAASSSAAAAAAGILTGVKPAAPAMSGRGGPASVCGIIMNELRRPWPPVGLLVSGLPPGELPSDLARALFCTCAGLRLRAPDATAILVPVSISFNSACTGSMMVEVTRW
mmetsp:Transcript_86259/g.243602  ORF Transcript_86259/g.243602 Transcript_86259/m.243602 type:complete len:303 (-) Transcript_86259:1151-2059(-)